MSALITIRKVDYLNGRDAADLTVLLDLYARDPMGGARPLAPAVLQRVCSDLASRRDAASFIADWHQGSGPQQDTSVAVGLINCFEGYSTFKAKPLLNIHDIVVHPRCVHLIDELTLYSYKADPLTGAVLPVLDDRDNHVIDALRYACEGARRVQANVARPAIHAPPMASGWRR